MDWWEEVAVAIVSRFLREMATRPRIEDKAKTAVWDLLRLAVDASKQLKPPAEKVGL